MTVPFAQRRHSSAAVPVHPLFSGDPPATLGMDRTLASVDATASEIERRMGVLAEVLDTYVSGDPVGVADFLRERLHLVDVVAEARRRLRTLFGEDAGLRLELTRDPETDRVELFALVETDLSPDEALEKLHQFDESWFLDQQGLVKGEFNVDVVYR